jgi:hypothetical protein
MIGALVIDSGLQSFFLRLSFLSGRKGRSDGRRMQVAQLRRVIDLLIYLSVPFGLALLLQLHGLVPAWLFYSVLAGWFAYLLVAIGVATSHELVYPLAFVLSILTLTVSLPQPEHYSFASEGMWFAPFTFALGSVLQGVLVVLILLYLIQKRKASV